MAPNLIPNPNRGRKDRLSYLVDTDSQYIKVPCGHCDECVHARQSNLIQRLQVEEFTHHLFYFTLTYNNESLPKITTSTGFDIPFADSRDITLCFKRLKKSNAFTRPFKYFCVSEKGELKGRPHFHGIVLLQKEDGDDFPKIMHLESVLFSALLHEWRRNYGSTRKPVYKPLCTYYRKMIRGKLSYNYDLHYMNPVSSSKGNADVAFYVTKYIMKPSDKEVRLQQALKLNLEEDEYDDIWKLCKSRMVASPGLGLSSDVQRKYVRECIERSKPTQDWPKFYNPVDGSSYSLSRYYYRKNVYTLDDALVFEKKHPDKVYIDDRAGDVKVRKLDRLPKKVTQVVKKDLSYLFNELENE